jgi:hypothetical protein
MTRNLVFSVLKQVAPKTVRFSQRLREKHEMNQQHAAVSASKRVTTSRTMAPSTHSMILRSRKIVVPVAMVPLVSTKGVFVLNFNLGKYSSSS